MCCIGVIYSISIPFICFVRLAHNYSVLRMATQHIRPYVLYSRTNNHQQILHDHLLAITLFDHDRTDSHIIIRPSIECSNFSFNDTYNPDPGLIWSQTKISYSSWYNVRSRIVHCIAISNPGNNTGRNNIARNTRG